MFDINRIIIQRILNRYLRKSSFLTKILFGVEIRRGERIQWDFTTLALKNCLLNYVEPKDKVLEIGTGPYAILSIFLKNNIECEILACDINEYYVSDAIESAVLNNASIRIVLSDLFGNIDETFDLIFFNSIYIARRRGEELGINNLHDRETDWCGGEDGLETISRFLEKAGLFLNEGGNILLGFNSNYADLETLRQLCGRNNFDYKIAYNNALNPSRVIAMERKK